MRMGTGAHNRGAHNRGRARAAERRTPAWVWWAAALMLAAATVPAVRAQAPLTAPPVTPGGPSAVPEVAPTTPPGSGGDSRTAPAPLGDTVVPQGGTARPVPDAGITATPDVVRPPAVGQTPVIAPGAGSNMPVIPPAGAAK